MDGLLQEMTLSEAIYSYRVQPVTGTVQPQHYGELYDIPHKNNSPFLFSVRISFKVSSVISYGFSLIIIFSGVMQF